MKTKRKAALLVLISAFGLAGCDIGNAPSGMSPEDAKANFEKQNPEDQIRMIQGSPATPQQKAERIAEIRKKYNLPEGGTAGAAGGGSYPGDPRGSGQ